MREMGVSEAYILEHFQEAMDRGYIRPYFQPVYRTYSEKLCDAESLARWVDPELGMLSPADFVPVLEANDLIYALDLYILDRACAFYMALKQRGTPVHSLSVNLSRRDFQEPGLFDRVDGVLNAHGVPVDAIKIEITESVMQEDAERFHRIFRQFHDAGYSIWIDDFGSGYSSLNVLQNYDFNMLKIDMLFLRNFGFRSRQVISAIVNMAKTLGIHTLAEGVETQEHYQFLKNIGCELIQGYYYSKPLSAGDFISRLDAAPQQIESIGDRDYWNVIGFLNPLSTNPLEDFQPQGAPMPTVECSLCQSDMPLALIEHSNHRAFYVYANGAYLQRVLELGYPSIEALERAFNDRISPQYMMIKKLVTDAVSQDGVRSVEYVFNNVYYRFKARCIAKAPGKAMLAASLRTFETEQEEQRMNEMLRYSQALFTTYEHVNILYPDRNDSERIFSTESFRRVYSTGTLREGIADFCRTEIWPADQARYMRFFDLDTLHERTRSAENRFVQQSFRINSDDGRYTWRTIRITRIPSMTDDSYLYTIQKMSDLDIRIAEALTGSHPELLE